MIEILLALLLPIVLLPHVAAGLLARQQGRKFWFWFLISFLIPVISLVVLLAIGDKKPVA
jgi:hypothetical protein